MDNNFRKLIDEREKNLHLLATHSYDNDAIKRDNDDYPNKYRTEFQRDRDRIIHSKAFRRLMHKTQVFVKPDSEHIRTRLTHTLEVMQIARSIARACHLNEDLTEAIALGHDLGHTPFGHIGEKVLNCKLKKIDKELFFKHNVQSYRIIKYLEKYYKFPEGGLNLTRAVAFGILRHSGKYANGKTKVKIYDKDGCIKIVNFKQTFEEQVVRLADDIAWINHDWEDGIRSGILSNSVLEDAIIKGLGITHADRINVMINDVIENFSRTEKIKFSTEIENLKEKLREKLEIYLWNSNLIRTYNNEAASIIEKLYDFFINNPSKLPEETKEKRLNNGKINNIKILAIVVIDYISGMTDDWCLKNYESFIYSPFSRFKKLQFVDECEWIKIVDIINDEIFKIKLPEYLDVKDSSIFEIYDKKYSEELKNNSKKQLNEEEFKSLSINYKKGEGCYICKNEEKLLNIINKIPEKEINIDDILIIKNN